MQQLRDNFERRWYKELSPLFKTSYFEKLRLFLLREYGKYTCYPSIENIFTAFRLCPLDEVRVVVIGMDPYSRYNQAYGVAFGIPKSQPNIPKSLKNILIEVKNNHRAGNGDFDYTLQSWFKQGIFLQNVALTVVKGKTGSHIEAWRDFTNYWIGILNEKPGLIWLLWGKEAQLYSKYINPKLHYILKAAHPSAENYRRNAGFFECHHFDKVNEILYKNNKEEILWY